MNWQQWQSHPEQQEYEQQQASTTAASAQASHGILASYPMASTTPSNHVARHLNNMTMVMNAPFAPPQPAYIEDRYQQPPPYTEYPTQYSHPVPQMHYAPTFPPYDQRVDTRMRDSDHALMVLNQPTNNYYPAYQTHHSWPSVQQPSPHPILPLPRHIIHRSIQQAYSYPPPPISSSSSSLAFALGPPPAPNPPIKPVHQPSESQAYYEQYLNSRTAEIAAQSQTFSTTSTSQPPRGLLHGSASSSNLSSSLSRTTPFPPLHSDSYNLPGHTPKKRKPDVQMSSPSTKRVQMQPHQNQQRLSPSSGRRPQSSSLQTEGSRADGTTPDSKLAPGRTYRLAYVDVPPKPWLTPTSERGDPASRANSSRSPDPEYSTEENEEDEDNDSLSSRLRDSMSIVKSARKTGDRDERAPLEKLKSYLEDLFEAEDALSPDSLLINLDPGFFSSHTSSASEPLLHYTQFVKATKLFSSLTRPQVLPKFSSSSPRKARTKEMDSAVLNRFLKIVERSIRAGEDREPLKFMDTGKDKATEATEGKKASKKQPRPEASPESDINLDTLRDDLEIARDSLLASETVLAILTSDRLPKELYSEELITALLGCIQQQLTKTIYPFVEASAALSGSGNSTHSDLHRVLIDESTTLHRRILTDIFQAISSCFPGITRLICSSFVSMSDSIIIRAVYASIGPFFVADQNIEGAKGKKEKDDLVQRTFGKSAMRGLRLDALTLIRSIFARHEEQRSWIIEEILNSLIKLSDLKLKSGQFRLRNGQSIKTVSALLMQLVQTSAHDIRLEADGIRKTRHQSLQKQDSLGNFDTDANPIFLNEHDLEEVQLYQGALDPARKVAKSIIAFLTTRSGKTRSTKSSNEAEYRTIFENLVADVLTVLHWPEWPAANLILSILIRFMISSLDEVQSSSQNDNNAMRTIAIDHLGLIASRIRQTQLKSRKPVSGGGEPPSIRPLEEITNELHMQDLQSLLQMHREVVNYLAKQAAEDQAYESARELNTVTWGQELASAMIQIDSKISDSGVGEVDRGPLLSFGAILKSALRNIWKDESSDPFETGSQEDGRRIQAISEEIGTIQNLRNMFPVLLSVIVSTLDAPAIFLRTKALRALGQVVTVDPSSLSSPNVRTAIESHLLDSSPAVRDAAVELVGKYMLESAEVAETYFHKLADRIVDTGVSVRKRVLKLLRSLYSQTTDYTRQIEIAVRLAQRVSDEDDGVKELAIRTLQEIWFEEPAPVPQTPSRRKVAVSTTDDQVSVQNKVVVIMGVAASRHASVETLLHNILANKPDSAWLLQQYSQMCAVLIEGLIDATDLPGFSVYSCVKTLYIFTSAYPPILQGSNLSNLLPYLNTTSTATEDQAITDYLLRIFRVSIPHLSKSMHSFGIELQQALRGMVLKPTFGIPILQESIACLCVVVEHLTHDAHILVALLKSCNGKFAALLKKDSLNEQESKLTQMLILITSLLAQHFDFEATRTKDPSSQVVRELEQISQLPVVEHVYSVLVDLQKKFSDDHLQSRILQCLGFLFRAQPTLMTLDTSARIMDGIFSSSNETYQVTLLKTIQEFLVSEATKHAERQKGTTSVKKEGGPNKLNMDELIGNTTGFADSGVASAIVQRYLRPVQEAALSRNSSLQSPAVDILSFTVRQGLSHPLETFPVVIALETSPISALSSRASALHSLMHGKHASILGNRTLAGATASYEYQSRLTGEGVCGFRGDAPPIALLHHWYSLVRDKRSTRQEFLKNLLRAFDVPADLSASEEKAKIVRYIAENLSTFDYKTQEGPLSVIRYLTSLLSTTGMQLVSHYGEEGINPENKPTAKPLPSTASPMQIACSTVVVTIAMNLKTYLKNLYGLSEEKCSAYDATKKSAFGDKATSRRAFSPISWHKIVFTAPAALTLDVESLRKEFLELWNEDGVRAEPEEEITMD